MLHGIGNCGLLMTSVGDITGNTYRGVGDITGNTYRGEGDITENTPVRLFTLYCKKL